MTRKSKMIPTAFSAASAIYSEIGDQPSDEFVHCPNAFPALSAGLVHNVHSSGRDKYAPPGGGHLTRRACRSVAERCKDATLFPRGNKKNARPTWQ
jgi:hypothetical protein